MVNLADLNRSNPWWGSGIDFPAIDQDLKVYDSQKIKIARPIPEFKAGNIYMLKGPRRVGKTVFLKLVILQIMSEGVGGDDIFYYSFDNVRNSKELYNMLDNFLLKVHKTPFLFLDEIQNLDGWEQVIKHLYDSGVLQDAVVVITGSISLLLKKERLPGRGIEGNIYNMRTLSFNQFCIAMLDYTIGDSKKTTNLLGSEFATVELAALRKALHEKSVTLDESIGELYRIFSALSVHSIPIRKLFELYMRTGGYPKVINDCILSGGSRISQNVSDEIYNYILSDAATLAGSALGDPGKAALVLKSVINSLGSSVSYNKMAGYVGLNQKTFASYSSRLENSFVILSFSGVNSDAEEIRIKKEYFADVFMHYAAGSRLEGEDINSYYNSLVNTQSLGVIVEEIVADGLIRVRETDQVPYNTYLKFFRNPRGREIDFVYKRSRGSLLGIEVKYQNDVSLKNDIYTIKKINEYMLLTKDTLEMSRNRIALPVPLLLAFLGRSKHSI